MGPAEVDAELAEEIEAAKAEEAEEQGAPVKPAEEGAPVKPAEEHDYNAPENQPPAKPSDPSLEA